MGPVCGRTYYDLSSDTSVDDHSDTQALEQQLPILARLHSGLRLLQQVCGPGHLHERQLNVQCPGYGINGVMEGHNKSIPFCQNL